MTTAANLAQMAAPGVSLGFKNRIINGDMRIDQRNAGASMTIPANTKPYCLDRWVGYCTGANVTVQQVASGITNIPYVAQITGAASNTAVQLSQRIESKNIADCAGLSVTLSALISNSLVTTVYWTANIPSAVDNFSSVTTAASGTFTVNSTLTQYSVSFTLPSTAVNGVEINFYCLNQTSGTFKLGQVQLEVGTSATSFEFRDYTRELAMCQRYYFKTQADSSNTHFGAAFTYNTTIAPVMVHFPVSMRVVPTAVEQTGTAANYSVAVSGSGKTCTSVPVFSAAALTNGLTDFVTTGLTAGQGAAGKAASSAAYLAWSAEL